MRRIRINKSKPSVLVTKGSRTVIGVDPAKPGSDTFVVVSGTNTERLYIGGEAVADVLNVDISSPEDRGVGGILARDIARRIDEAFSRMAVSTAVAGSNLRDMGRALTATEVSHRVHDSNVLRASDVAGRVNGALDWRELERRARTEAAGPRPVAGERHGRPMVQAARRYDTMETEVAVSMYLRGLTAPPTIVTARIADIEIRRAGGSLSPVAAQEAREEVVRRLLAPMMEEVRAVIEDVLENAERQDAGFRQTMDRVLGSGRG